MSEYNRMLTTEKKSTSKPVVSSIQTEEQSKSTLINVTNISIKITLLIYLNKFVKFGEILFRVKKVTFIIFMKGGSISVG